MVLPVVERLAGPTVSVLLGNDMSAFELGIVAEIFGFPLSTLDANWYQLTVCAEQPDLVPILGGAAMKTDNGLEMFTSASTVIVPGGNPHAEQSARVGEALRTAHRQGARVVSICTGTFALAAAGLLDGRRATTHWMMTDLLGERFPLVKVDPTALYVEDDNIFTSAGSASGIDLCIHLVRQDFGPSIANEVARRLATAPHREGYHPQVVETPVQIGPEDDRVTTSMVWALANIDQPVTVDALARQAHMSTRSYLRNFRKATGTSPMRWLIRQRIQASLPLLEKTRLSIEQVAAQVGFERTITYRHHFGRIMGNSPTAYRRKVGDQHWAGPPKR